MPIQCGQYIDLLDAVLSCIYNVAEIPKIDINFTIGTICKILIFTLTITLSDFRQYGWDQFQQQAAGWLLSVGQILMELHYYLFYNVIYSPCFRILFYKIADIYQLAVSINYLQKYPVSGRIGTIILYFCCINLGMSCVEILNFILKNFFNFKRTKTFFKVSIKCPNRSKDEDIGVKGGQQEFFFGCLIGCLGCLAFIMNSFCAYSVELNNNEMFYRLVLLTLYGQIFSALLYFACLFFYRNCFAETKEKSFLFLFYGLNCGMLGLYAQIFFASYLLIFLIRRMCIELIQLRSRNKVQDGEPVKNQIEVITIES